MNNSNDLTDPVLAAIIINLQSMDSDMKELAGIKNCAIIDHIKIASLEECKFIIDSLADRIVDLVGCAGDLENISEMLQDEIDSHKHDLIDCLICNGTGLGRYDSEQCSACGGKGFYHG